eukprot:CAMPEP_0185031246 /NCGR_PEP_ID=MMETSP1103-20130426/18612_1 /TAXON_ID=36769 /ORGANISM="Paraphysomonas bandaiensis, Strain Caron Lab Isolate" /LENGTH=700 /DNA_ID=CAMNT_0027566707 /DNA_START=189 /DNA_END=2291 /DNA_ORIENTATION=-
MLEQISTLKAVIEEYSEKMELLELKGDSGLKEASMYQTVVEKLEHMNSNQDTWIEVITALKCEADEFWYPSPADINNCMPKHTAASKQWRQHKNGLPLPNDIQQKVLNFKTRCQSVVSEYFADLLSELEKEEADERSACAALSNQYLRLANKIPTPLLREIESSVNLLTVVTDFPLTHFLLPSKHFAKLLGYTLARMITAPFLQIIVNTAETNLVVNTCREGGTRPSTVIFYRRADRELACIHWEVCETVIDGHYIGYGCDITSEINMMKNHQGANMQRILRQWLHSIRNASFQQQAQLIEEDVMKLRSKLDKNSSIKEFDDILSGLKTLIYTTKASVGLIDQALYSKGLMSCTCVADFVNALVNFAPNFTKSEKLENINVVCTVLLNQNPATPEDFRNLYVGSDMLSLQSMIDNIFSNALRYTDPEKGVVVELHVVESDTLVQFLLRITDFREGGLPSRVVRFYQENINFQKVLDLRQRADRSRRNTEDDDLSCTTDNISEESNSTNQRSSMTGVPHIVDTFHQLTGSGEHDLDMLITVTDSGTTYALQFSFALLAPPASIFEDPVPSEIESLKEYFALCKKLFLVVDDSAVVRRMLVRLFDKLDVPCHSCVDGSDALDWFADHQQDCCGIITDLEMPKMGGETLIRHVKEINPTLPCVVVSGNETIATSMPKGAERALMKPIAIDDLQEVLKEMLKLG